MNNLNLKSISFILLAAGPLASIGTAQTTLLFDFGQNDNETSDTGWNNFSDAALSSGTIYQAGGSDSFSPVDSLGAATGFTATLDGGVVAGGNNENNVAGAGANSANSGVSNAATGTLFPDVASQDALNIQGNGFFTFSLSGLSATDSVDLYFYGAASNFVSSTSLFTLSAGTATITSTTVQTGSTVENSFGSILNVTPDGSGIVSIVFTDPQGITGSEGGGGTRARWNALEVTVTTIPEPSTYALMFGVGTLALVAVRRRFKK